MATIRLPKHVLVKTLRSGATAYYYNTPSRARKAGCPIERQDLGTDPAEAMKHAVQLNEAFDDWRLGRTSTSFAVGTIGWMAQQFEAHPKFKSRAKKTQRGYRQAKLMLLDLTLKSGTKFGHVPAKTVKPRHADRIYAKLQWVEEEKDGQKLRRRRLATANAAMRYARRLWSVGLREEWVESNPFQKMEMEGTGGSTRPVERGEVTIFVAASDKLGMSHIGTAALMGFEWCQRESDVIGTIGWKNYEPGRRAFLKQAKTEEWVWLPLVDGDGPFFPELEARLATTPRRGTLIVMRAETRRAKGVYKPYDEHLFRKHFRKVRIAAGLPADFTMMACRHGGLQELSDSEATDREMIAMSGHKDPKMLTIYTKRSAKQAANAARKRRAWRTESAQKSEPKSEGVSE